MKNYKISQLSFNKENYDKKGFHIGIGRVAAQLMLSCIVILVKRDIKCKVPFSTIFNHGGIGVVLARNVKLGEHCTIGQNVTIGASRHGTPTIERGVVICPHVIIFGNCNIGHHSIIGAGAVVLHDIPPWSVVVGCPGHVIRKIKNEKEYWSYRRGRI